MTDGLRVTIAGLDFYGQGSDGFIISPDGFSGWDDGVDMRLEKTARPYAHGSFNLPVFQDSRTVSVSGNVFADSSRELLHLGNRLTGLLAGGGIGRVQVERFGDVQWADGRLAAKTMFTERGGQNSASFQIQLWCPDPRKFGNSADFVRTNGTVSVFHRGNYNALPTVVVRGSAANGYRLNGPGGLQYKVTRALVTGIPHRIEFTDGRLRVNGTVVATGADSADVWPVPPGQSVDFDINVLSGGTAEATITITDTYI